jgi:hypothetical protein
MICPLPPVPDLHDLVSPEVLTELMLAILNRGARP